MKLCVFVPFNIPYCSFLPHNSLLPSVTPFYWFWNSRRYLFCMCYSKFCKSVPILQYDRSIRSHMLKRSRNPSQDIDETPKPAKQSKLFSLKRERSQNMACRSHWNNPIPKKHQTVFSQISIQTVLFPHSQLCSTGEERKEKKKKKHTIKKAKKIPCCYSKFQIH